jgi:dTDP-4-amino-4,6-dideoxygalactose transaminase
MKVPFIDLTREWSFFEEQVLEKFKEFGRAGHYILGEYAEQFEQHLAEYFKYKYAVGVSTGLSALEVILRAYNIGVGGEVITVANSAVATSLAISYVGAKPIFCDIGGDFLMDVDKIESLITPKTKAILPVHLFGKIANMEAINTIAQKHNLVVVEDACQAHGANFSGSSLINTKALSFYPTKNLGALGEGGAILTNYEKVKEFAISYRNYGQKGRYNHEIKANNYRIDALQCAFMDIKLARLDEFVVKRRKIAEKYIETLQAISQLKIENFDPTHAYHIFVVRVLNEKRDALRQHLSNRGIESLVHYPTTIHKQPCYEKDYPSLELKNTDAFQKEMLSLPCYPFLTAEEQELVIKEVFAFFG